MVYIEETVLLVFQRPQIKSDIMPYAKEVFSRERAYESK